MNSKYVTVFVHRGYEICTLSPARPGQFGYIIDHGMFADQEFVYIQHAIEAIDVKMIDPILRNVQGYRRLTEQHKHVFIRTFDRHQKVRWEDERIKYSLENLKEIKWDPVENCLKVYYRNGEWWHYTLSGDWY